MGLREGVEWDPALRSASENYRFLCSAVAPRPVAWVTTRGPTGVVNAAPFSWFNAVSSQPPMVMLAISNRADGSLKDTVRNIMDTGEFVVNAATRPLAHEVVASSAEYPSSVSETEALGLRTVASVRVGPPRIASSPIHLECRLERMLNLGTDPVHLVIGEVVHVGADDAVLDAAGNVDPERVTFLARMGGTDYTDTAERFTLKRPKL